MNQISKNNHLFEIFQQSYKRLLMLRLIFVGFLILDDFLEIDKVTILWDLSSLLFKPLH